MAPTAETETLLAFFKALADVSRLRIVGLLAREPHTVEALAAALNLADGTVSHHLRRLSEAELVESRAEGHYRYYSLCEDAIQEMATRLLGRDELPKLADDVDHDAFDRKVLATFTDESGRITAFPAQQKKYRVLLRYAARRFEPGRRYSEKQVNAVLAELNEDTARLRRSLVEVGHMDREGGGGAYWLREEK